MPIVRNENFIEYVKNKRVALVGPAKSIEGIKQGSLIDSYDIVCRVKSFYVQPNKREFYGSRVDVLYTDNNETNDVLPGDTITDKGDKRLITMSESSIALRESILKDQVKFIVSTYPKEEWFFHRFISPLSQMSRYTKVRILPGEPYMTVREKTMRPNGGFSAILDLQSLPIKELYITGIDFYRSLYKSNYLNSLYTKSTIAGWEETQDGVTPDGKPDRHNPDLQFKYFKYNIYQKDDRIKVDKNLKIFLEDDKYENFKGSI
tara:strand:- start:1725 stop:2510 length:786 start_codon:yes stop_codon:yes gene_type:complete